MRPIVLTIGILFLLAGGFPPIDIATIIVGLVITLYALIAKGKVKK